MQKEKTGANKVFTTVERGCTDQCEERNDAYVRRVTCCQGEGCNGAWAGAASLALVLGVTVVAAMWM